MSFTGILRAESLRTDAVLEGVPLHVHRIRRANARDTSAGQPLTGTFIEFDLLVPQARQVAHRQRGSHLLPQTRRRAGGAPSPTATPVPPPGAAAGGCSPTTPPGSAPSPSRPNDNAHWTLRPLLDAPVGGGLTCADRRPRQRLRRAQNGCQATTSAPRTAGTASDPAPPTKHPGPRITRPRRAGRSPTPTSSGRSS
jgi:hypothetical protein